jgi:catechol 2,3-dioxygenase-like lactoylglutathione lyase family enzyme
MSAPEADASAADATVADVDLKLEVVVIPVSDVDRAKAFYGGLDWRLDADFPFDNAVRIVQITPPGSPCSIQFGVPAPDRATYGSFATFTDPDGNRWLLQEITRRLPGRVDAADTSYTSVRDLADAMRRVHGGRAGRRRAADLSVRRSAPDQRA